MVEKFHGRIVIIKIKTCFQAKKAFVNN